MPDPNRRRAIPSAILTCLLALPLCACTVPESAGGPPSGARDGAVTTDSALSELVSGLHEEMTAEATGRPGRQPGTAVPAAEAPFGTATPVPTTTLDPELLAAAMGEVIVLTPVPCGAVTLGDRDAGVDCTDPVLRSGAVDGREFIAALTFDLIDLPPGAEVLYAGIELTGLDADRLRDVGRWYVQIVDLPPDESRERISFSRLTAAPTVGTGTTWRLRAGDLAPGGRNTLDFDADARAALTDRLGTGQVTFRIDGPTGVTNLFGWYADGARAPRLRLGYIVAPVAAATAAGY